MEIIGTLIAAALTLMVFSYIFGDNFLFKLASHIFVGVSIGYAMIVIIHQVFIPALTSGSSQLIQVSPALLLCGLLILKIVPPQDKVTKITNMMGNVPLAFVVGVGAALAVGGVLFGTLIPQVSVMMNLSLNPSSVWQKLWLSLNSPIQDPELEANLVILLNNIIIILGTIGTFFYFSFVVRAQGVLGGFRDGFIRFWAGMGRLMIIFTLAALFANTVSARVAILVSRLQFLAGLFR